MNKQFTYRVISQRNVISYEYNPNRDFGFAAISGYTEFFKLPEVERKSVYGKWIKTFNSDCSDIEYHCSVCGRKQIEKNQKFCICGAEMLGE